MPYNGDPERVVPLAGALYALDALRAAGIPVAVVSNQSGVGRGLISLADVEAVNARVEALLGPFAGFFVCPHAPEDDCDCRKPKPKLVLDAAHVIGVAPTACVVIGDKASDIEAAHNAGARGVLVSAGYGVREAITELLAEPPADQ